MTTRDLFWVTLCWAIWFWMLMHLPEIEYLTVAYLGATLLAVLEIAATSILARWQKTWSDWW